MDIGAPLPIDAILPALARALAAAPNAVLQAPPGAGKTTRVPLALLDQPWARGKIVMLEPRRLAARGAAERMAASLGQDVGRAVGFRIRGETRVGPATRIEVVTEGILTRMLQADPALEGISAVIFDEVHERNLNADLGLALCLEAQSALRPDLRLVAMSATLDAAPFARLMGGAPVITAEGVSHPVETFWAAAPLGDRRLEDAVAQTILDAIDDHPGDLLAFLPGAAEIGRTAARLAGRLPEDVDLREIFGDLPFDDQRAALAPAPAGRRKVVLATAIAETSLTVEGVRIVVDAGLARRARFDPGSGMSRLVTERASRAEADQRRGRAGRTAPGVCVRMWTKGEEGAMPAFAPPEIAVADLAALALELALWGARDPTALPFLDPPPAPAYAEARALLEQLSALDRDGRITAHGRDMAAVPAHPRLAHMMLACEADDAPTARALAAILSERDPLRMPGVRPPADIALRLAGLTDPGARADRAAVERICATARRFGPVGRPEPAAAGRLLALAYPDRIAMRRPGAEPRFLLSGGKGARLDSEDGLAGAAFLVVADADGDPREARIRLAAPLTRAEIDRIFPDRLAPAREVAWSRRDRAVTARAVVRLGALALDARNLQDARPDELAAALAEGVRDLGLGTLPWTPAATALRHRAEWLRVNGAGDLADLSDEGLLTGLDDWLTPHLAGLRRLDDLARLDLTDLLRQRLGWNDVRRLDAEAPPHLETPSGARAPIDYGRAQPTARARPQHLYGLDRHPTIAGRPVLLELVSPADRPIATTADLPGFWRGAWTDVRRDMRGRYPRHDWPEEPWAAAPTTRARPRGA
ncbi:MAG: ATP-dependent helicase HrpB [Rubrimonas sp.]